MGSGMGRMGLGFHVEWRRCHAMQSLMVGEGGSNSLPEAHPQKHHQHVTGWFKAPGYRSLHPHSHCPARLDCLHCCMSVM